MIQQITEVNFGPNTAAAYATLHQATVTLQEMGERTITTQVRIDGDVVPDFTGWELEFKGERFVLPDKMPQATKDNTTRNSLVDLTFSSWAVSELKRYFFMSLSEVETGVAIADQYKASVILPVESFVQLFNKVLRYYFGDQIRMDLFQAGSGIYSTEPVSVDIDYSYIWDVLQKFYELFDLRWRIEYDNGVYVIKVGYSADAIDDHDFEYGYDGGLLRFERQVQDSDIKNILLGRGGEKNLPYRYFKRVDELNPSWAQDPDAIPELANVYFDRLRDINFRWYVRGWMRNPNHDTSWENSGYTYPTYSIDSSSPYYWAYQRGLTDAKFNPVEYVKDDDSIEKYGERWGALDDNDDVYPTIQGVERVPIGRVDEIVSVSEIATDDIEAASKESVTVRELGGTKTVTNTFAASQTKTDTLRSEVFTVPSGSSGSLSWVWLNPRDKYGAGVAAVRLSTAAGRIVVFNSDTGVQYPADGLPAGSYYAQITLSATNDNTSSGYANVTYGLDSLTLNIASTSTEGWKPTFDVWIKNIWETTQAQGESDSVYAARVWEKILGDRVGNEAKIVFSDGFMSVSEDYEFTIASYPVVDRSKSINGVPSEWKITLYKSDAEFEATGLFIPNASTGGKPAAGDHFFFIGIDMPNIYVVWAEEHLNAVKTDELDSTSEISPTWVVDLDKVRVHTIEDADYGIALADRLASGSQIRITDRRFTGGDILTLYVQSITYTWNEPSENSPYLVPDIEVVLSDKVVAVESPVKKLQNSVQTIRSTYAKSSDIESIVRRVASPLFLRKTGESDSSDSPTTFSSKISSRSFRSGVLGGEGWGHYEDGDGNSVLELDKLIIRKELQVNELVANQIAYVGGRQITSAASIQCSQVVDDTDGYICYFDQKQGTVGNLFQVGDIAMGQVFDSENAETRYYRAVVTEVGENYITISKTQKDGAGAPMEGDVIVQYGNTTDTSRQYVIVKDVIGGGYERMISGLNSVTSAGTEYYYAGRTNGDTPRWFVGDLASEYALYKDGVLNIQGRISVRKSDGTYQSMSSYIDNIYSITDGLQTQIDGQIQSWSGSVSPLPSETDTTHENYPASSWTDNATRLKHIGDIYVDESTGQGYRYSRVGNDGAFYWLRITDEEVQTALEQARIANEGVAGLQYLKTATNSGTLVDGGLVLTSLIQLGQASGNTFNVLSGINGIIDEQLDDPYKSIAAWYGGPMVDHEADSSAQSYAKSLFRMDGSGYLASGNIYWNDQGYGGIPGITWSRDGQGHDIVTIGGNVRLESLTGDSVTDLLNAVQALSDLFELVQVGGTTSPVYAVHVKHNRGLYSDSFISAGGVGSNSGGGGGGGADLAEVWDSLENNNDDYANWLINIGHIPSIPWSKLTGTPTTLAGYGITDAYTKTETDSAITAAINALPNPMLFQGSLGTDGTITSLPAASPSNEGWTYKVITAGTYAGQAAKIGDMFISNGTAWIYVPSGDEPSGTVTSVGLSVPAGLSVSGSPITTSGTLAISFESGYSIPTTAKQTAWDAKYDKPSGGIPKTDLESAVQTSLTLANTAVQPQTTLSGYGITDAMRVIVLEDNGTTTAGTWLAKSNPASLITAYTDGLVVLYKLTKAGAATTTLNINGLGAKTVYRNGTTKLTTQYAVGAYVLLYYATGVGSGSFQVFSDYDANSYAYLRQYVTTGNVEYPLLARYNTTSGSSYYTEYARYAAGVTLNPSVGSITASKFIVSGATSSGFLKGDGSVDTTSYLPLTGGTITGDLYIDATLDLVDGGYIALQGDNLLSVDSNYDLIIGASILGGNVKLNGGGTLYYNDYKVWHEGNDGASSGLDADLLDGQHGSYYATASSVTTLQSYFTSEVANSAARLSSNSAYTAFGNTFFNNGVPVSIAAGSNLTNTGSIIPAAGGGADLGSLSKYWSNAYIYAARVGQIYGIEDGVPIELKTTIVPSSGVNLGSSSRRFATIYGVNGDLSGTLSVTGATSLSGGLTVSGNSSLHGNVTIGAGTTYPSFTLNANSQQGLKLTGEDATGSNDYLIFKLGKLGVHTTPTSSSSTVDINGTAFVSGFARFDAGVKLVTTKKIWFGDTYYIELDSNNYLHTNAPFYSDGFVSAGGVGSSSGGGGGLVDTIHTYSELGGTFSDSDNDVFNAYTVNKINTDLGARISALEGGSATSITPSGSGSVVTGVTKSGTVITVAYGDLAFSQITGTATASQVPAVQDLTNFSTKVYDASASRTKNYVLAAPSTANGAATFRKLVASDIPDLSGTYQPLDADLTAIAGLSGTSGLLKKTAANTWTLDTTSYATSASLGNYLPLTGGTISGNLSVTGTTSLTGAVTMASTLAIGSTTTITANTARGYGLRIQSNQVAAHISLERNGVNYITSPDASSINFFFGANSAINAAGSTLSLNKTAATITGTLAVSGNTTLSSNLTVNGANTHLVWDSTSGGLRFVRGADDVWIQAKSGSANAGNLTMSGYNGDVGGELYFKYSSVKSAGDLIPSSTNAKTLGSSSLRWSTIYGVNGDLTGNLTAASFVKSGGTASQFLKADGSVDSNTYLTTSSAASTYVTALGTSGNYLTWTKNGVVNNITVPYASIATQMQTETLSEEFIYTKASTTLNVTAGSLAKIKGKSVVWNQLVQNGDASQWASGASYPTYWLVRYNAHISMEMENGWLKITRLGDYFRYGQDFSNSLINGHKYYIGFSYKPGSGTVSTWSCYMLSAYNKTGVTLVSNATLKTGRNSALFTCPSDSTLTTRLLAFGPNPSATNDYVYVRDYILVDLTLMFGAGNEPATVAEFEELYPLPYYGYNAGTLVNNAASGIETVGRNIWDEEWEVGRWAYDSYSKVSNTTDLRCKNPIPVTPGTTLYMKMPAKGIYVMQFDENFDYVSRWYNSNGNGKEYTIPNSVRYLTFFINSLTTYSKDITISLSDTAKNGTYTPYWKSTVNLNLNAIEVKSPNIWDEEWLRGYYDTNGNYVSAPSGNYICNANSIPVISGSTYYFTTPSTSLVVLEYDANRNLLSRTTVYSTAVGGAVTVSRNTKYIDFTVGSSAKPITTYSNDICICKSGYGHDGIYYPHGTLTITGGLKSAGTVYDEVVGDKGTFRLGDGERLSTLTWSLGDYAQRCFNCTATGATDVSQVITTKYAPTTQTAYSAMPDKSYCVVSGTLRVRDTDYSNADTFKASLADIDIVFPLKTPQVFELVYPIYSLIRVEQDGTLRRLPDDTQTAVLAPFRADIQYGINMSEVVDGFQSYLPLYGGQITGDLDISGTLGVGGDLSLAPTSHIDIGPLRIEYDATNKALHITKASSSDTNTYGLYADGFVTAGGVNANE